MHRLCLAALMLAACHTLGAQNVLPTISKPTGTYHDQVSVYCTFPEGCSGGVYWTGNGRIIAKTYTGPITLTQNTTLHVAGTDAEGTIITDDATAVYTIDKVTKPYITVSPEPGTARSSFYLTKLTWHNAESVMDRRSQFEADSQPIAWITDDASGQTVSTTKSLWDNPTPDFALYFSYNYKGFADGQYSVHFAPGAFTINGELSDELIVTYYVGDVPADPQYGNIGTDQTVTDDVSTLPQGNGVVTPTLATPQIVISGNHVAISTTDADVTIKYWINNRMQEAQLYEEPFAATSNCKVSAVTYNAAGEVSATADAVVSSFPAEDTGVGMSILVTEEGLENVTINAMSPNHRYVCGYTQDGNDPYGFVWDLSSNELSYLSTSFCNAASGISDDGTVIGWRMMADPITGVISESQTYSAWCRDGVWTAYPTGFTVRGITGDNRLYGSYGGRAATYDIATAEVIYYSQSTSCLTCVADDGQTFGGSVTTGSQQQPTVWYSQMQSVSVGDDVTGSVTSISGGGTWVMVGSFYRYCLTTSTGEHITSMGTPWGFTFERASGITDDGMIYGTFDETLYDPSHENMAMVYRNGYWQNLQEYLEQEYLLSLSDWQTVSGSRISGDGKTMLCTCYPAGVSSDDAYLQGMAILLNVATSHLAPTGVTARQMKGLQLNRVSWSAPLSGADEVTAYNVWRDGERIATVIDRTLYFDSDVNVGQTYSYTISAVYNDGEESQQSYEATVTTTTSALQAPRDLSYRQSGINDVNLTWSTPYNTLPALQYYDETSEVTAFGSGQYNSEWAVLIPASDLESYAGLQIRTFQFLPTSAQRSWTIRLYTDQDVTPFYEQRIDTTAVKLSYGDYNTVPLDSALDLPIGHDLYIALYIETAVTDNMLGVSWKNYQAGYTDLCRIEGVHDHFVCISRNSTGGTYNLTLPLGVGVCSEQQLAETSILGYRLTMDSQELADNVSVNHYAVAGVAEGRHVFTVSARYASGQESAADTLVMTLGNNTEAYRPIDDVQLNVTPGTVTAAWQTPLNDDQRRITYCQGQPLDITDSDNVKWQDSFGDEMQAAAVYPVAVTGAYADDYEITQLYYCPLSDGIEYTIDLMDEGGTYYFEQTFAPGEYVAGEVNYITLPQPVTISAAQSYRLIVDCYDGINGDIPLALDDDKHSGRASYSDLIRYDVSGSDETSWSTLTSDVAQWDRQLSWYMGLVISQRDAKPMPVDGYNVRIDGVQHNDALLPADATTYAASHLSVGTHTLALDVVYTDYGTVAGAEHTFVITAEQPDTIYTPGPGMYYGGLPADGRALYSVPTLFAQAYQSTFDCNYPELSVDLTHYMGIGVIDLSQDTNAGLSHYYTTTYYLNAACDPAEYGLTDYCMAMYDQWSHPVIYDRPATLATSASVSFTTPHEGLVVNGVNFTLCTADGDMPQAPTITLTEVDDESGEALQHVTLSPDVKSTGNGRYAVTATLTSPLVLSHAFTITVDGISEAWLPTSDQQPCINVQGYFNFIGLYGYGDKMEYGVAADTGGEVELYEPATESTDGEITFPIETTFGQDDIVLLDAPSWLHWVKTDGIWNGNWDEYEVLFLILTADELPEGVTGRNGIVTFTTRDGASQFRINVKQGNAAFAGINTIHIDASGNVDACFDLMGRRITNSRHTQFVISKKQVIYNFNL